MRSLCGVCSLIFLLAFGGSLRAQQWCPPGAEWSFTYHAMDWSNGVTHNGVLLSKYTGDTLVGGHLAQRISSTLYYEVSGAEGSVTTAWPPRYTRLADDVVYIWDLWAEQYDTLLWFGAGPGDQWPVVGSPSEYRFVVLATTTVSEIGIAHV